MPFVDDTFTGTSGTLLTAHVGETGATWTKHPDLVYVAGNPQISNANRLRGGAVATTEACYASGVPAAAEYDVEGPLRCASVVGSFAITGRMDTVADTMYQAQRNAATNWRLLKRVAATATVLGTSTAAAPTVGASQQVKLEIRDAAKKLYVDGVELISSADNAITAAGRVGIWDGGNATDATGFHLDRITATDLGTTVAAVAATATASGPTPTAAVGAQPAAAPTSAGGPTPAAHIAAGMVEATATATAAAPAVDAAIGFPPAVVTAAADPPGWGLGLGPPAASAAAAGSAPEARVLVLAAAAAAAAQHDPPAVQAAVAALAAAITAAGDAPGALIVVLPPAGLATAIGGLPLLTIPAEQGTVIVSDTAVGAALVGDMARGALALTDTARGAALVGDSG